MGPLAQSDGHDSPRLINDAVPSLVGGIEGVLVSFERAVGEVGLSQELPEVLDRVQFGGAGWQEEQGDVIWHLQLAGGVPSGAIEQEGRGRRGRRCGRSLRWSHIAGQFGSDVKVYSGV